MPRCSTAIRFFRPRHTSRRQHKSNKDAKSATGKTHQGQLRASTGVAVTRETTSLLVQSAVSGHTKARRAADPALFRALMQIPRCFMRLTQRRDGGFRRAGRAVAAANLSSLLPRLKWRPRL
ncbi:hypothetical protein MTO96_020369 [Rhipicephalus appendiculatus]